MKVRKIDGANDWTFGKGLSSYAKDADCVAQNIKTRVLSWVGDCFFAAEEGIDYSNLLDKGQQNYLNLAIKNTILGTNGVVSLNEILINLDSSRNLTVQYSVDTIFGNTYKGIISQGVT